jgi:hypothetical protein
MWPFKRRREDPIQDIDNIDIVGKRKDGGVDLVIVASSKLDGSPEHQRLLLAKIESYLAQVNTPAFQAEFSHPRPDQVTIVLSCSEPADPIILQLIEKSKQWVEENNARVAIRPAG